MKKIIAMKKITACILVTAMAIPILMAQEPETTTTTGKEPATVKAVEQVEPMQEQVEPMREQVEPMQEQVEPMQEQIEPIEPLEKQVDPVRPLPQKEQNQGRHPSEVKTIFDPGAGSGGYGAFTIGYTRIADKDAIIMGGRGEWIMGHGFGLGMGGYGFINDPTYNADDDLNYSLAGGYGGLIMEPIILGWFPVHIALPILIGAGGVSNVSYTTDWYDTYEYYDGYVEESTAFFVAEGGVELEFNLVRFFRLALFGKYRYTTDIIMTDVAKDALHGWSAGITFKFGSF